MPRHEYYNEDGSAAKERCPRCEHSFLADHGDRLNCGKCGYTEFETG